VFSSILFLSTFTNWLTNYTPSISQQIHLHLNTSSSSSSSTFTTNTSSSSSVGDGDSVAFPPLFVHSVNKNFTVSGAKTSNLIDNRLARTRKSFSGSKSEPVQHHVGASNVNFTAMREYGASPERVPTSEQKKIVALDGNTQVPFLKKIEQKGVEECDLTKGYWVFDESYALYSKDSCPFIDEGFDCVGNGRLDRDYSKWRWQPKDCDVPRYSQFQSFGIFFFPLFIFLLMQYLGRK